MINFQAEVTETKGRKALSEMEEIIFLVKAKLPEVWMIKEIIRYKSHLYFMIEEESGLKWVIRSHPWKKYGSIYLREWKKIIEKLNSNEA